MRNITKRHTRMLTALLLALLCVGHAGAAAASSGSALFWAKGAIAAPEQITLLAPMGGQVQSFNWLPGDEVEAGQLALALTPTQIFAPCDGVIRNLRAQAGEQAAAVQQLYGALCVVERDDVRLVQATTSGAHDDPENRDVRVGDVLRVRRGTGDSAEDGMGTVIQRDGTAYIVEMPRGAFELEDSVRLYRGTGRDFPSKDAVGRGKVVRPAPASVLGDGCVAVVWVSEGQRVQRGDLLFTLDAASARYAPAVPTDADERDEMYAADAEPAAQDAPPAPDVHFAQGGIIAEVLVRPGQFVAQGQALMTLLPTGALEASLEVDELDIARVALGQRVLLAVDAYPGREWSGVVRLMEPMGIPMLDTTKFRVRVTFTPDQPMMIGMHVTGYWE